MKNTPLYLVLGIFTLGLISRLIFSGSNVFFFDGDEAIVGLMALDHLNGDFPLFFYGQTYGFAFIESLMISIGVLLFGNTMLAIKIPMLLLWITAVSLLSLTIYRITGRKLWLTIIFTSIFLFSPTWLVWSMKARGGYLTAFLFSSLLMYWIFLAEAKIQSWKWVVIGVLSWVIFEAQPLWFFPMLPIIGYAWFSTPGQVKFNYKPVIQTSIGFLISFGIFQIFKSGLDSTWNTPSPKFSSRLEKLGEIPTVLQQTLGGNYFLSSSYEPSNKAYAGLYLLLFLFAAVAVINSYFQSKNSRIQQWAMMAIVASLFSFSGFLVKSEPRYLLPFFGFSAITIVMGHVLLKENYKKVYFAGMALAILVGIGMLRHFKDYSFVNMKITGVDHRIENDKKVMDELLRLFEHEQVKYVYTTNEFMQYQINYMTNGEVLTMGRADRCRTPWNVPVIRQAYEEHPEQFAVIGYNFNYQYSGKMPLIRNKIFYVLKPTREIMTQVGFFNDEKPNP